MKNCYDSRRGRYEIQNENGSSRYENWNEILRVV